MGLQERHGRPAYYRSVRQGGRVRSVYLGIGQQAIDLAERDAAIKRESKRVREASEQAERQAREWFDTVEVITRAALIAAGCHQHKRQWRRKRTPMDSTAPATINTTVAIPMAGSVLERFRAGDKTVTQKEARAMFRDIPGLLKTTGNPARLAIVATIERSCQADDHVLRAATMANVERVIAELAGPKPTPTEMLLAERAAACWLEVNLLEVQHNCTLGAVSADAIRRLDSANRRFLAAVRTLAVVRKLDLPDVRINIDSRQVHLGGKPDVQPSGQGAGAGDLVLGVDR